MYYFATDFDDTLYFHNGEGLREEDVEAIRRFQKAGNRFGLCTGRSVSMFEEIHRKVEGKVHFDFTIFANGTCLTNEQGQIIQEHFLPEAMVREILSRGKDVPMVLHHRSGIYQNTEWPYEITDVRDLTDGCPFRMDEVYEISLDPKLPHSSELIEEFAAWPGVQHAANSKFVDIFPDSASKGKGLLASAALAGVSPENTAAIGDSYNDISMIQEAGTGFTFPSSPRKVRDAADIICTGVCEAIDLLTNKTEKAETE